MSESPKSAGSPAASIHNDDNDKDSAIASPPADNPDNDDSDDNLSDDESVLSDVDEAQFEDFDPANIAIDDRPAIAADEENLKLIGRHKRKRAEGEEGETKKKERKREKKSRRQDDSDDGFELGKELSGKRKSKRRDDGEERSGASRKKAQPVEIDEESLAPEERRRLALDRAMDSVIKKPSKGRRRNKEGGIDLADMYDKEIDEMRQRMTAAASADAKARSQGQPAMYKVQMLPEVVNLLNRNQIVNSLVDPELNLLEAVKFFLEPLEDGSLPAYSIQRDLFAALAKLPMNREALIASGIGKVVIFYTKSKRPQLAIKRQADRLLADWTRPLLNRTDDYTKKHFETAEYREENRPAPDKINTQTLTKEEIRARELLPTRLLNRARLVTGRSNYTIAPVSNLTKDYSHQMVSGGVDRWKKIDAAKRRKGARD